MTIFKPHRRKKLIFVPLTQYTWLLTILTKVRQNHVRGFLIFCLAYIVEDFKTFCLVNEQKQSKIDGEDAKVHRMFLQQIMTQGIKSGWSFTLNTTCL